MLELKLFPPTAKATSPSLGSEKGRMFSRSHCQCSETEHKLPMLILDFIGLQLRIYLHPPQNKLRKSQIKCDRTDC